MPIANPTVDRYAGMEPHILTEVVGVPSLLGQTLGSFRVLELVGEGGMGQVFKAEHVLIGRKAAIKVLSSEVASDKDVVSRFFNEARAVNDIRHPNIVEVTDFGHFGSQPYIVMELLEGETLEDRLARVGVIDPATAARMVAQVASAVGAAHDHGMVHRDLKPANIFLCRHPDYPDFVKVLDFGIAKLTADCGQENRHKTVCGAIIGTPAYMSPEQCLGDANLDHRSDIYSLGVVIYQMVTGRRPFEAEAAGRLIMCHVQSEPPAPCALNPALPVPVGAVILRALEKQRENRYASMREFRDAFLAAVAGATNAKTQVRVPEPTSMGRAATIVTSARGDSTGSTLLASLPTVMGVTPPPQMRTPPPVPVTIISARGVGTDTRTRLPPRASPTPVTPTPTPTAERINKQVLSARLVEMVRSRITNGGLPLPQLSPRMVRCLDLAAMREFSFGGMAALLAEEPRLAARVVQVANSTGPTRMPAHNAEQAIRRLGAAGLRTALLEIAARPVLESREARIADLFKQPWHHAMAVALLTQRLMQVHGCSDGVAAEAFHAGLLHDAGKPVVGALLLDIERQMASAKGRRLVSDDVMVTCIELTSASAGARVACVWQLPDAAAQAIERAGGATMPGWSLGTAIRLADALAALEGFHLRREDIDRASEVVEEIRQATGIDESKLSQVVVGLRDSVLRRS
jgi:serine/threonine protein kinase/HD-like signal output (HDOD) protein